MLEYCEFAAEEESPLECVWQLRGDAREVQRIAPDGRFELIVHLAEPFEELGRSGWKQQSDVLIAGQMTRPLFVRPGGTTDTIGIRLKSWAAACVIGLPACEQTNQVANAREVEPKLAGCVRNAVAGRRISLHEIAGTFTAKSAWQKNCDERVVAAVRRVELTQGSSTLEELTRLTGVGGRQLERLFHAHVGVGPKLLSRIRRFSNVFARSESPNSNWAAIATDCGYADQSHLIRDFSQFAGAPPGMLLSQPTDLALYFTSKPLE